MESLTRKKLAFIGCMGSGKSSLARRYTAKYGGALFDTDKEFSRRYGDISDFFAQHGESEFRKRECELLEEGAYSDAAVISTGGGAVLSKKGMSALRRTCDIVYLTAPYEVLKSRIERSDRPLKNDLKRVLGEREALYKKYADFTIDTSVDSLTELEKALTHARGNRYDVVLVDSDDTLLDFRTACAQSVGGALTALGVHTDLKKAAEIFAPLTRMFWQKLESGEITREQLFEERAKDFARRIGASFAPSDFNLAYRAELRQTRCVRPGAIDFLQKLRSRGIAAYIITNADSYCAEERLKPLMPYVNGAFVSDAMGCQKPEREFFEKVIAGIGSPKRDRIIVFGDGETSDILGAVNSGLDCCRYAPDGDVCSMADNVVCSYDELLYII